MIKQDKPHMPMVLFDPGHKGMSSLLYLNHPTSVWVLYMFAVFKAMLFLMG
jgi:hypothetical protein